jgi:DNA-nicking Smr family endonuclease
MSTSGDQKPRRSRQLSADEHSLWSSVTRLIKPLRRARPQEPAPARESSGGVADPQAAAPQRVMPPRPLPTPERVPALAPFERRLRQRLARGNVPIERRLDLHGLTQREAHDALVRFLHAAHAHGARVVLVVTGKGARADEADPFAERGVLRRLVPQWLKGAELHRLVLGFETAALAHGGEGALYVRLRRPR